VAPYIVCTNAQKVVRVPGSHGVQIELVLGFGICLRMSSTLTCVSLLASLHWIIYVFLILELCHEKLMPLMRKGTVEGKSNCNACTVSGWMENWT